GVVVPAEGAGHGALLRGDASGDRPRGGRVDPRMLVAGDRLQRAHRIEEGDGTPGETFELLADRLDADTAVQEGGQLLVDARGVAQHVALVGEGELGDEAD